MRRHQFEHYVQYFTSSRYTCTLPQENTATEGCSFKSSTDVCQVLWSNETKVELFGQKDVKYVWKRKGEASCPRNAIPIVKHGCGQIPFPRQVQVVHLEGIMRKEDQNKIIEENLKECARKLGFVWRWWLQQG